MLTRRRALVLALATVASPVAASLVDRRAVGEIAQLEKRHGGRLGVFALDLERHRTLAWRADERFKLYSTFKGLLAAFVLHEVANGRDTLAAVVRFGSKDILPASPVTTAALQRGALTVGELCEAIMFRSDNAAANLLMARFGGPARLTAFLRSVGDTTTRIDSYEGNIEGRPSIYDTTTPRAIVDTARQLLLGTNLAVADRDQLERWMAGNVNGAMRLRAAFPSTWKSGDRTGTGDGICNDYAFARRPGQAPLIVSAYYAAPGMSLDDQEKVLRAIGEIVVDWQRGAPA